MQILITGATGFIGSSLTQRWLDNGHQIIAYVRNIDQAKASLGSNVSLVTKLEAISPDTQIDAIINLAGAPIASRLWTKKYKKTLLESRLSTTKALVSLIKRLEAKPEVMISASAAGYYGRRGAKTLSEQEPPQDIFMSRLCYEWEKTAEQTKEYGVRIVTPRISVVLGNDGGALPTLMRPAKFGAAAVIGSGEFYFPWIHKLDLLELFDCCLENKSIIGPVNAVAPGTVTQQEFTKALCRALNRPQFIKVPAFAMKMLLGEMSDLFTAGQHMSAEKALTAGFAFKYPDLQSAFTDLLK